MLHNRRAHLDGIPQTSIECFDGEKKRAGGLETESFPYFYQVFQGDEYLKGADLICARGFAADAYRKAVDLSFFFFFFLFLFFFLSLPSLFSRQKHRVARNEEMPGERRWNEVEEVEK